MRITNTSVFGFEGAMRGMRNPLNSWSKSDSKYWLPTEHLDEYDKMCTNAIDWEPYYIGQNDLDLAQRLLLAGGEHCKFMRMIHVQADIDMPRYWHSEADTYHFNTKNSCSTMHKLLNTTEPITLNMFEYCGEDLTWWQITVHKLEELRAEYRRVKASKVPDKQEKLDRLLLRAKRILPEGFLQMRTWDTNYAELRNMYFQRKNHRLKEEWQDTFCEWVQTLPWAEELILFRGEKS